MSDPRTLAQEYRALLRLGCSPDEAAEIVDAEMEQPAPCSNRERAEDDE